MITKDSNCAPLFADDFRWAVVRLATLQTNRGEPGRLLFATVTLLSPERPPPFKMVGVEHQNLGKNEVTVYFRRTVLSAPAAVEWYRSLGGADSKTPTPSRSEDIERLDGIPVTTSELADDPLWPNLGVPMGEGLLSQPWERINPAPFIGSVAIPPTSNTYSAFIRTAPDSSVPGRP